MSIDFTNELDVHLDFDDALNLAGIPTSYSVDITHLPKIQLGVDPLTINPLDVSVRLKEFPSVRTHVPADFTVGFSVFGLPVLCIRFCGEAQVITEPYEPNPCERCQDREHAPTLPEGPRPGSRRPTE